MLGYYTKKELSDIGFGSLGINVMISRGVELANVSNIHIGNNSRIDTFVIIAPSGDAIFRIGNNVHICAYTILNGLASITLEDYSGVSCHCSILSSTDNFNGEFLTNSTIDKSFLGTFSAPIIIQKHAAITTGTTILPGVTIGVGTVVGANSLVKESTEPFSIVAGTPARFIRKRSSKILEIEMGIQIQEQSKRTQLKSKK